MNTHYLELFYYVARHGGVTAAVRQMPYGIQQPAISAQILLLEDALGVKLFNRRPFELTPPGRELYAFIKPFFDGLEAMEEKVRGNEVQRIRIGASEAIFRDHLPAVAQRVKKRFPKLRLLLRSGYHPQLAGWLDQQEIDLAITTLDAPPPPGIQSRLLISLPLVLLVERRSRYKKAADLWALDKIEEPLICLPPTESITRRFQEGLRKLGVEWLPSLEASSMALLETYVASGYGIGVTVAIPQRTLHPKVRPLPLEPFDPVPIGMLWKRDPSSLVQAFLDEIQQQAKAIGEATPSEPRPAV